MLPPLLERDCAYDFELLVDRATAEAHSLPEGAEVHVVETSVAATQAASHDGSRSPRDLMAMALAARRLRPDALLFPTVYTYFPVLGPVLPRFPRLPIPWDGNCRVIVGIHDTIAERFPDLIFPGGQGRRFWNAKVWLSRQQASRILTVSEHARGQLMSYFGTPHDRIGVVEDAPDPVFRVLPTGELDESFLETQGLTRDDRFLAYLGGINPHKNLLSLVRSVATVRQETEFSDLQLRLVGDLEREAFTPGVDELRQCIEELELQDAVRFTGYLEDEDVVQLFNFASGLVLPSFAEGYGLPAVEAASCGVPVIATSNSPLPQLLEGGGLFVDPHQPDELTAAIRDLFRDEAQRKKMADVALAQANRLSWSHSVDQLLDLIRKAFL